MKHFLSVEKFIKLKGIRINLLIGLIFIHICSSCSFQFQKNIGSIQESKNEVFKSDYSGNFSSMMDWVDYSSLSFEDVEHEMVQPPDFNINQTINPTVSIQKKRARTIKLKELRPVKKQKTGVKSKKKESSNELKKFNLFHWISLLCLLGVLGLTAIGWIYWVGFQVIIPICALFVASIVLSSIQVNRIAPKIQNNARDKKFKRRYVFAKVMKAFGIVILTSFAVWVIVAIIQLS